MDYQRVYTQFIADRRANPPANGEYTEKHHILPKSLGGDDSLENLISVTAEDHYFAHMLLAKIYGGPMWYAVTLMTSSPKDQPQLFGRNSIKKRSLYGYAKRRIAKETSRAMKDRHADPEYAQHHSKLSVDRWKDPKYRAKQVARMESAWKDPVYVEKMKQRSQACPRKLSAIQKKLYEDPDYKAKMARISKEVGNRPEFVEKMKLVNREINSRPDVKAAKSASSNKMWASQDRRDLQSRKIQENARAKISPVINLDLGIWFKNLHFAYDWLEDGNMKRKCGHRNRIAAVCRGEKNTAGGYRWAYTG